MSVECVARDWQLDTGSKLESALDILNNNKQFFKLIMSLGIQL